jgi:hypothetical protein
MKIFNTFQKLWNYCLFCPICQEPSRTISISIGPDEEWRLTEFQKEGSELKLFTTCTIFDSDEPEDPELRRKFRKLNSCSATFIIDCDNNTFVLQGNRFAFNDEDPKLVELAKKNATYIYLHAKCNRCDNTYLDTMDIGLDPISNTLSNFQIEREGAYLMSEKDKFHISLQHDRGLMSVSRMFESILSNIVEDEKVIDLPLVNLDFSNAPKVVNKIKTLILFS